VLHQHLRCFHCLGLGHFVRWCTNPIRCHRCFHYGHIQRSCFKWRALGRLQWAPKAKPTSSSKGLEPHIKVTDKIGNYSPSKPHFSPIGKTAMRNASSSAPLPLPSTQSTMANFAVDPQPPFPQPCSSRMGVLNVVQGRQSTLVVVCPRLMRIVRLRSLRGSSPLHNAISSCMTSASTLFKRSNFRFSILLCIHT
jgi:hypothetical protein